MRHKPKEKICQECGTHFWGSPGKYYCDACAKKVRASRVVRERTCIDCGATFMGGPKALRCTACRKAKQLERQRQARKEGSKRPLGSTDKCVICGKEYIVEAPLQKYCSEECRLIGINHYNKHIKVRTSPEKTQQKRDIRANQLYVCKYCNRSFKPIILSGRKVPSHIYCSDYCMKEQKKIQDCIASMKYGQKRRLDRYIDKRNEYKVKIMKEPQDKKAKND